MIGLILALACSESTPAPGDDDSGDLVTVPGDLPPLTSNGIDADLLFFLTPRDYSGAYPPSGYGDYLLVVDGLGQPVWWKQTGGLAFDFRPAADGSWSANMVLDGSLSREAVRLEPYSGEVLDRWPAPGLDEWDEVVADPHELVIRADGSRVQSIAGYGDMDLSAIGGDPAGRAHHSGVLEVGPSAVPVATWSTEGQIDLALLPEDVLASEPNEGPWRYGHVNCIDPLDDGWLVSLRSPGEILRIVGDSGEVLWRLGGARSDFTFVDDPRGGFFGQHSARWVAPDRVLLFDNGTNMGSAPTGDVRVVEYQLDEVSRTAKLVFTYVLDGAGGTEFAGSVQRLADGRTVVGFGSTQLLESGARAPSVLVLDPAGLPTSELALPEGMYSYRVWAH